MLTEAWTRPKLQHRWLASTAGGGARRVSAAWSMQGVSGPTDPSRKSGRGLWRCSGGYGDLSSTGGGEIAAAEALTGGGSRVRFRRHAG